MSTFVNRRHDAETYDDSEGAVLDAAQLALAAGAQLTRAAGLGNASIASSARSISSSARATSSSFPAR